MKSTLALVVGLAATFSAVAQKVENDDMYFTSKDRAKLNVATSNTKVQAKRTPDAIASPSGTAAEVGINPTDSYSARTVNPEYSANPGTTTPKQTGDYFVENYTPTGVNSNLNGDYSNSAVTPYSSNNPYGYGYSGYSPYMSPAMGMSPYMGMGMNPYMSMGMGMGYGYPGYSSFSMSYGSQFGYSPWGYSGMGMGYGYGSMYSPWGMYDPFYSSMSCPYSFYGYNNYGYSGYGYPGSVIYVDNNGQSAGRNISYGKRTDRSTSTGYQPEDSRQTTELTRNGRPISSGRTRAGTESQPYYEKSWRSNTNATTSTNRSHWSNVNTGSTSGNTNSGSTNSGRTSSWGWDNGNSGNSSFNTGGNTGGSQPRSSWSPSDGGGSRSTGGSVGGGGGGGGSRSRGRD